jgi:hypothetical protein
MRARVHLALVLAGVAATPVLAESPCPTLPARANASWEVKVGPDFNVCLAKDRKSKAVLFGIYLGWAPSFTAKPALFAADGVVGGHAVKWYRSQDQAQGQLARETLAPIGTGGFKAHIWVLAKSDAELSRSLSLLEGVRFN